MINNFEKKLKEQQKNHLYRTPKIFEKKRGVYANYKNKKILLFSTNDYLGMSNHKRVVGALIKAAKICGVGAGSARLISGTSEFHYSLERKIAELKKKEKALVFSSGYLANVGTLTALAGKEDVVVMDKLCHASIIDGARLSGAKIRVFPHKNYKRCEEILKNEKGIKKKVLVTETLFSMDGDLADMERLAFLKKKYNCLLVVDDAHGTGVLGPDGRGGACGGVWEKEIDIIIGTLSKALGGLGGFVAAGKILVEYITNFARPFIFATALPPVICAASEEAINVLKEEPELRDRLLENIKHLTEGVKKAGFLVKGDNSPIIPVILGDEKKALDVSKELFSKGFFVPAVRYPTVAKGEARLRIAVSGEHTKEEIESLIKAFRELKK